MKKRKYKCVLFIIASAFLSGLLFPYFFLPAPDERFEAVDLASLSILDYCAIKNDPSKYSGKVLKVRAPLGDFMHGAFFEDSRCQNQIYPELTDDRRTALSFYEPNSEELHAVLQQILKNRKQIWETMPVVAIGRFKWEYPRRSTDHIKERTSFHFEVYSVAPFEQSG